MDQITVSLPHESLSSISFIINRQYKFQNISKLFEKQISEEKHILFTVQQTTERVLKVKSLQPPLIVVPNFKLVSTVISLLQEDCAQSGTEQKPALRAGWRSRHRFCFLESSGNFHWPPISITSQLCTQLKNLPPAAGIAA